EQRFKVRVRGEDGAVDDDGEAPEHESEGEGRTEDAHPVDAQHQQLTATLAKMMPVVQQTITAHPERRAEIMAMLAAFQAQMKAHQFAEAKDQLTQVLKLLQAAKAGGGETTAAKPGAPAKPVAPLWDAASERALDQATGLVAALRSHGNAELDRMADDLMETL